MHPGHSFLLVSRYFCLFLFWCGHCFPAKRASSSYLTISYGVIEATSIKFLIRCDHCWSMIQFQWKMQHAATHCNAPQHSATNCNTLQHTVTLNVTHYNTLQHTATYCSTLPHAATHCNTLQHTATHCSTLQHTATHCNTLQHTATHCSTLRLLPRLARYDMCSEKKYRVCSEKK